MTVVDVRTVTLMLVMDVRDQMGLVAASNKTVATTRGGVEIRFRVQ